MPRSWVGDSETRARHRGCSADRVGSSRDRESEFGASGYALLRGLRTWRAASVLRVMAMGFGKIVSGISLSSLMNEPVAARWLFVFMISQADRDGNIRANRESFRRSANMKPGEYDDAIGRLEAPDPMSASKSGAGVDA